MHCCGTHKAIQTTAPGLLCSPIKHMCVGSVWQGAGQYLAEYPIPPLVQPQGRYMAAIQCFLYDSCLAKHLESMSRAGLAKCHTAFFKRTSDDAPVPNSNKRKLTVFNRTENENPKKGQKSAA